MSDLRELFLYHLGGLAPAKYIPNIPPVSIRYSRYYPKKESQVTCQLRLSLGIM